MRVVKNDANKNEDGQEWLFIFSLRYKYWQMFAINKFNQSSKPEMKGSTNNSACEL